MIRSVLAVALAAVATAGGAAASVTHGRPNPLKAYPLIAAILPPNCPDPAPAACAAYRQTVGAWHTVTGAIRAVGTEDPAAAETEFGGVQVNVVREAGPGRCAVWRLTLRP